MSDPFTHGRVAVNGALLHWTELSPPTTRLRAPPVVLLHGLADANITWRAAAPLIARDRQVLMPDLLGCGWSARPDASYSLDWHAAVIARWIEALQLEQVDVVGHSFGGGLAQMLLLKCNPRIRRLSLVASGGLGEQDRLIPIAHAHALVEATRGVRLEAFEGCGHYLHQLLAEPQPSTACVRQGLAAGPHTAF